MDLSGDRVQAARDYLDAARDSLRNAAPGELRWRLPEIARALESMARGAEVAAQAIIKEPDDY